ncbi:biopolymer transporter ExbD [bacterium]|jgi:biopolymer transport protein TolR|nr:biopolymer transporter ExbD [bacterium]
MAFSTGGSSSGPGSRYSTPTTLAEINVTPLVDVMLVLLIVFMISAPLMQQGVEINLPKAEAGALTEVPDQLVLTVNKGREVLINDKAIVKGTLRKRLEAIAAVKPNVEVFIRADAGVNYGFVAQVMAEVKQAKINHVGLVTVPGDDERI